MEEKEEMEKLVRKQQKFHSIKNMCSKENKSIQQSVVKRKNVFNLIIVLYSERMRVYFFYESQGRRKYG